MNIKTASLIAACALAATPLAASASERALNATAEECMKAFSTTYLPKHAVRDTRVRSNAPSALDYWKPTKYTIELTARGADSREVLAQARCLVDNDGVVLILESTSIPTVSIEEVAAR